MSWFVEKTPDVAKAFSELRNSVYRDGAFDESTKELISIADSVLMRCERCTEIHAQRTRKNVATNEQIAEAIACAMFVAAGSQLSRSEVYEKIFVEMDKD